MAPYKPRVLVLESDSEFRTLLRSFFEDHELSVDCAYDVDEAAVLLAARPYELVLFSAIADHDVERLAAAVSDSKGRTALIRLSVAPNERGNAMHMIIDRPKAVRHLRALAQSARDLLSLPASSEALRIA